MSSPNNENEEVHSTVDIVNNGASGSGGEGGTPKQLRPPAKRPMSAAVIEISDTESDDSDVCAVNSYQATADEVKRIRGAEYSSSSSTSSSDYSSDSESPWEDDSIVLESEKVNIKVPRAQLNPRANRMDVPKINPKILEPELIDQLSKNWKEFRDHIADEVTLTCDPFRVCLLHDLLHNSEIINNIVDDMNTLDWNRKKMDLYEFHQTADLASLTWQRSIRGIYDLLKTELMTWVSKVTGLELTSVSASCSLYGPGDHLLVHDDLLGDRRVAFILYLAPWRPRAPPARPQLPHPPDLPIEINGAGDDDVKPELGAHGWAARLGGALQLLRADGNGRPARVRRRVFPRNNMMALFPVGSDSFHEVGEVLSLELPRLSINGWFHGPAPSPAAAPPPPEPAPPEACKPHNDVVVLSAWLSPAYMAPRARAQVQAQMEANSEVCLTDILAPDQAARLLQQLEDPAVSWEEAGPADQRHYQRWTGGTSGAEGGAESAAEGGAESGAGSGAPAGAADPISELTHLLSSVAWTRFLADCTDLTVTALTKPEVQRWRPGDYTLLPPRSHYLSPRLQAVLHVGCRGAVCGGATTFVAPDDAHKDGALVAVPPQHNALGLVYCDAGAAAFTKYYSRMTASPHHFYVITATYYE